MWGGAAVRGEDERQPTVQSVGERRADSDRVQAAREMGSPYGSLCESDRSVSAAPVHLL